MGDYKLEFLEQMKAVDSQLAERCKDCFTIEFYSGDLRFEWKQGAEITAAERGEIYRLWFKFSNQLHSRKSNSGSDQEETQKGPGRLSVD
jgi:hypothetical protein